MAMEAVVDSVMSARCISRDLRRQSLNQWSNAIPSQGFASDFVLRWNSVEVLTLDTKISS